MEGVEKTPVPPPAAEGVIMRDTTPYTSPLLIHRLPESRRQRLARLRTLALVAIAAIAASGVVMQQRGAHHAPGAQVASANEPFTYFPG